MSVAADGRPRPLLLVASPLAKTLVEELREAAGSRYQVAWRPDLYPVDYDVSDPGFGPSGPAWSADQRTWWLARLAQAEVIFDQVWLPHPELIAAQAPRLRWVQASIAGLQGAALARQAPASVTLTSAAGVHAIPLTEHVVAGLLYLRRNLRVVDDLRSQRVWRAAPFEELAGSRALVIGLGQIGSRVADTLEALGVQVLAGVRRAGPGDARFERVLPDRLDAVLPTVQAVVLCCPLTASTRNLLSAQRIAHLDPRAIVVNIGRGALVDEAALVAALATRRLAGAVLDTFTHEPLDPESPLWSLDNVVLTSHSAGVSRHEPARLVRLFVDNLRRYDAGEPLMNVLDREEP